MEQTSTNTFSRSGVTYHVTTQNRLTVKDSDDAPEGTPTQVVAILAHITLRDGRKGKQAILGFGYENEDEAACFSRLLDEGKRLEQGQALAYFQADTLEPYIYDVLEMFGA